MRDNPIDLTPLDPDAEAGAEERFVNAVMSRVAMTGSRYPVRVDVLWGAWSFARPVLIAASIAIVVATLALVRSSRAEPRRPSTVAESIGVPPVFQRAVLIPASAPGGPR